jgi:uncharacterized protein (DUF302 family)
MSERAIPYGNAVTVHQPYPQAVQAARAALAAEGFGVLCEIDLAATLHARLGVAVAPYVILGACNPPLAHLALAADPEIGLLLPCNVVVRAGEAPGTSVVAALDPEAVLGLAGREALAPIAREVAERLRHVLAAVAAAAPAAAPDETVEATEEIC